MADPQMCAAFACRERATTTRKVERLKRRENPAVDGWAMGDPVWVVVCETHRTAPDYQLDLG